MTIDRDTLKRTLSTVDFPASKEELVAYAENHGVDEDSIRALRALPLGDYENARQAVGAVPVDQEAEQGESSSDKAQQHRHNTQSGLAEHQTETPVNPIVEELGENRGR